MQNLMAAYKNKTQNLCYTKKITLSLYRYVCMHASYASSTAAHVTSNARTGAGRCSSNFLFSVCNWGFCLHLHSEMHVLANCLWLFLAIHFLFIILECNLFIIILLFLLSFCCFTSLYLLGLCSNVSHHFLQGMMLVAASQNRALVDLYNLKDHFNQ